MLRQLDYTNIVTNNTLPNQSCMSFPKMFGFLNGQNGAINPMDIVAQSTQQIAYDEAAKMNNYIWQFGAAFMLFATSSEVERRRQRVRYASVDCDFTFQQIAMVYDWSNI